LVGSPQPTYREQEDRPMSKQELMDELRKLQDNGDPEIAHSMADDALLAYIADPDVRTAFDAIQKWYA
jgi:hypothetical protein